MKQHIFFIFVITCYAPINAQIPGDWDLYPPRDTAISIYSVGVSQPLASEQAALTDAWRNAVQSLAYSIGTLFQGRTDVTVHSEGYASEIEDAYTVSVETASFSTGVRLTGVREAARKIERVSGAYIARVLVLITREDYNKAVAYIENEAAAFRAYSFFAQKGLVSLLRTGSVPAGFQDYFTWLRASCVIIAVEDAQIAEQIGLFCKKVYRNADVFAEIITEGSRVYHVRIVYGAVQYYNGLLRALQNAALFSIRPEGSMLTLALLNGSNYSTTLVSLKAAIASMKDSSKYIIVGSETIQTYNSVIVSAENIVINQFKSIAARQFGLQVESFSIPSQYISDFIDEEGLVSYLKRNAASVFSRYLIICYAETQLKEGMSVYKVPPLISASCRFVLYDLVTGETAYSNIITTLPGAFSPMNLQDQAVIATSREALRFLSNPKNQPDLSVIMREILQ